ncbi:MAG: type II toxin-antitoxin system Phd/YefM family antitoxin [Acidimicrobiia bacterium]|nr:type II toxin-antitoxin system Phd/YefM family antitoxin [Acidimicrobiia bacterium]MCY4435666.1 type II toxin-antitoxin system Phd/YefM family antitoxin [bacterium]
MALHGDHLPSVAVSVSEFRANCGPLLDAVRDGQEIVITKNGRPVAEVRPPRSPREEFTGSLFGFCRDIIALPEGFDFDKESVWAGHEEDAEEVLSSWDRQEPELVVGPSDQDG